MAEYISTKFGANAAQEWKSSKQTVLQVPAYLQVILARHAERVKVTRDLLNLKLTSLRIKKVAIEGKFAANPGNHSLMRNMQKVKWGIAETNIELMDEVKMELTNN